MKCLNLHAVGDICLDEKEIPELLCDEVLVKVKCCGVCGSDIGRVYSHGTYHFPTVIGHEFSGEVVEDKSGEYTGKRVTVFPLLPCFSCDMCKSENYAQCRSYDYYGSRRDGGFSEYIAVKKWNLTELPDHVSFEEGAMCEPTSVALHAVKKLGDLTGKTVLITGAGPIGIISGFWARKFGADKIYYIDIDTQKIEFAEKFGFEEHDGREVDVCIEGTGAASAVAMAIASVKAFGKIVLMGNPGGDVSLSAKDYQNILRKELSLLGTWNSARGDTVNDWREALSAMDCGDLPIRELITHRVSLENCISALEMMHEHREFYCKVVAEIE